MYKRHKFFFFIMFFLSGFCSLAYQVIWLRKAFAIFGVITPIMSVVISVFMLGLLLGSWIGGKWIEKITVKLSLSALYFYATAELLIGLGGISVPSLFSLLDHYLVPSGSTESFTYLFFSALVIIMAMLPWCVFMGMTYPLMMAFLKEKYPEENKGFSFLYFANVLGAMTGVLFTAIFLIELFGFQHTLLIAACLNITVTLMAVFLGKRFHPQHSSHMTRPSELSEKKNQLEISSEQTPTPYLTKSILFITGFSSMGIEIAWVRAFTPALGNLIYSFATLLFTYLMATCIGSYLYRHHRNKNSDIGVPLVIAMLSVSAFLTVVLSDWRVPVLSNLPFLSIIPFCFLLGYLTPKLIDEYSEGKPGKAGKVYAINIAGCVLGPLFTSYLLLPLFGSRISIIILTLPILWLFVKHWKALRTKPIWRAILTPVLVAILFFSLFISISFEEGFKRINSVIRHDYTATVVSYGSGFQKGLLVNGVGMAILTTIAKHMGHMPLAFLNHKPESALVICFGMGVTFRSLASWGIDVTAVELVPSVKDAFGYYHTDTNQVLSLPNVRIIIDDGRRYLRRTDKKFDVITIDPPPPPQTAGSSLLYSEEFYSLIRLRLKKDGILQQWFPGSDSTTLAAVTKSLINSFPYVLVYASADGQGGYHYLASMNPIHIPTPSEAISRMPKAAKNDHIEWEVKSETRLMEMWSEFLQEQVDPSFLTMNSDLSITDDRPINEYYILRYLTKQDVQSFLSWMASLLRGPTL